MFLKNNKFPSNIKEEYDKLLKTYNNNFPHLEYLHLISFLDSLPHNLPDYNILQKEFIGTSYYPLNN
mgnify:CR=1 FL=1